MREIAYETESVADVEEQPQPVRADRAVLGHDKDVLEEAVYRGTEPSRGRERTFRVPTLQRCLDLGADAAHLRG